MNYDEQFGILTENRIPGNQRIGLMHTGHWTLEGGNWTLDIGHWNVDTGYRILDTGHWSVDTGQKWSSEERNDFNRMHKLTTNGYTDKIFTN